MRSSKFYYDQEIDTRTTSTKLGCLDCIYSGDSVLPVLKTTPKCGTGRA